MEQSFKRGDIRNESRAKQINSFSGLLRRRGITPTDIDGLIDYNGKAFIILEGKYGDAQIPMGQKLALANLANAINEGGKQVVVLVFRHYVELPEQVDVSAQVVTEYFYNKQWRAIREQLNVLEAIAKFETFCENKDLII